MRFAFVLMLAAVALGAQSSLSPFDEAKARALLRTQLPCLGCHELDGEGGRSAPSLTTVGARRSSAYIGEIISDPQRRLPGVAMPRHEMPATTRELIVRFLSRTAAGAGVALPPAVTTPAASPDGAALYTKWCASCHGAGGRGDGTNARFLPVAPARHADAAAMSRRPDASLYDVIAAGGAAWDRSARMPAFGASLTDPELRALVSRIRTLCGCEGPAWSRHAGPAPERHR